MDIRGYSSANPSAGYDIIVQQGDTLSEISAETGLSLSYLIKLNGNSDAIMAGDKAGRWTGTVLHVDTSYGHKAPKEFVETPDKEITLEDQSLHHRTVTDVAKLDVAKLDNGKRVSARQIAALNIDALRQVAKDQHVVIDRKKDVLSQLAALELPAGIEIKIPQQRWGKAVPSEQVSAVAPKSAGTGKQAAEKQSTEVVASHNQAEVAKAPDSVPPVLAITPISDPTEVDAQHSAEAAEPQGAAAQVAPVKAPPAERLIQDGKFRAGAFAVMQKVRATAKGDDQKAFQEAMNEAMYMPPKEGAQKIINAAVTHGHLKAREVVDAFNEVSPGASLPAWIDSPQTWNQLNQAIDGARKRGAAKEAISDQVKQLSQFDSLHAATAAFNSLSAATNQ